MSSKIRPLCVGLVLMYLPAWNAHANSVGFDAPTYAPVNGQLAVTLVYVVSDFAMFGGGFDVLYEAGAPEFVSSTMALLPQDITQP